MKLDDSEAMPAPMSDPPPFIPISRMPSLAAQLPPSGVPEWVSAGPPSPLGFAPQQQPLPPQWGSCAWGAAPWGFVPYGSFPGELHPSSNSTAGAGGLASPQPVGGCYSCSNPQEPGTASPKVDHLQCPLGNEFSPCGPGCGSPQPGSPQHQFPCFYPGFGMAYGGALPGPWQYNSEAALQWQQQMLATGTITQESPKDGARKEGRQRNSKKSKARTNASIRLRPGVPSVHELRVAKARLRRVGARTGALPRASAAARSVGPQSSSEKAINVEWVLQEPSNEVLEETEDVVAAEGTEVAAAPEDLGGPAVPSARRSVQDFRQVRVTLDGALFAGCEATVHLNGEPQVLKPGCSRRKGIVRLGERRFSVAPLTTASTEGSPVSSNSEGISKDFETDAETPRCIGLAESMGVDSATVLASVTLDMQELEVRTAQELVVPDVEILDILDNAVTVRTSNLTGERFELTVYASGTSKSMNASTIVQQGPVRTSASVHRIGQLVSSQVYVVWVKVFSAGRSLESAQKGFKTPQARVKTIWDEPDHEILGVAATATTKEITKAWRAKSLQFHPDKETDPDKKEAAEDMMKRLNLAKQNMLKSSSDEPYIPSTPSTPSTDVGSCTPRQDTSDSPWGRDGFDDSDEEWNPGFESDSSGAPWQSPKASPKAAPAHVIEEEIEEEEDDDSVRCSLRMEVPRPPQLKVVDRGLTTLSLEATGLSVGCKVELQRFVSGSWSAALPCVLVTRACMKFTLKDLEENSPYRLRLRTVVELEPLRLLRSRFVKDEAAEDAAACQWVDGDEVLRRSARHLRSKLAPVSECEEDSAEDCGEEVDWKEHAYCD